VIREAAFVSKCFIILALLCGSLSIGCAGNFAKRAYTPDEVRAELGQRLPVTTLKEVIIPFEINDEIRALAHNVTRDVYSDSLRTRAIINAIIDRTGLSISYDYLSNKTAIEVFEGGQGNCLAYTNLFVGMAREIGLDAVYVDVITVERISKEADVIVNNGHVTGGVIRGPNTTIIDFTRTPERDYIGYKIIDDLEAMANYYNNQGYLYGYFSDQKVDDPSFNAKEIELEMYKMALEIDPNFPRALNNLGVAYKRRGRLNEAVEQYKLALDVDPDFADARSNLGGAYYSVGRVDDAIYQLELATKASEHNGYFYHHLGVIEFQQGNYNKAMRHFRKALTKDSKLADSRYYIGEVHLALGRKDEALKEYERTLEIDPNYLSARSKIIFLMQKTKELQ